MVPVEIKTPDSEEIVRSVTRDEIPKGSTLDVPSGCTAFISRCGIISRPYLSGIPIDPEGLFFEITDRLVKEDSNYKAQPYQVWFIDRWKEAGCSGVIYLDLFDENDTLQLFDVTYRVSYTIREPIQFLARLLGNKREPVMWEEVRPMMAVIVEKAIRDSLIRPIPLSAHYLDGRENKEIAQEDVLWRRFSDGFSRYGLWPGSIVVTGRKSISNR